MIDNAYARGLTVGLELDPSKVLPLLPEDYEPFDAFSRGWYAGLTRDD